MKYGRPIFVLFALLVVLQVKADEMLYPELNLFGSSDLAVEASFVKNDGPYFWIKVLTVYKKGSYSIKQHDYLRVQQLQSRYSSQYSDLSAYHRARFYLKRAKNDSWVLYTSSAQSAKRLFNDTAYFHFNYSKVKLPIPEFNQAFKEFIAHYQLDSSGRYRCRCSEAQKKALMTSNRFIATYENDYIDEMTEAPEAFEETHKQQEVLWSCGIADLPAVYNQNGDMNELGAFLRDSLVNPPEVKELGITGTSIVRFTINTDGNQSDYEVLRSLGPSFDEESLRLLQSLPAWKPAEQRGRKVACQMTLPIRFKLPE